MEAERAREAAKRPRPSEVEVEGPLTARPRLGAGAESLTAHSLTTNANHGTATDMNHQGGQRKALSSWTSRRLLGKRKHDGSAGSGAVTPVPPPLAPLHGRYIKAFSASCAQEVKLEELAALRARVHELESERQELSEKLHDALVREKNCAAGGAAGCCPRCRARSRPPPRRCTR